jgi:hypothetical protein
MKKLYTGFVAASCADLFSEDEFKGNKGNKEISG